MNEISFSYEKMSTKTRFEEEAKGNSEMAYLHMSNLIPRALSLPRDLEKRFFSLVGEKLGVGTGHELIWEQNSSRSGKGTVGEFYFESEEID